MGPKLNQTYMKFSMVSVSLAFHQSSPNPWIKHHQFNLQVVSDIWFPWISIWVVFFDFSSKIQLFSNIKQSLFVISTFSMVSHAFHSNYSFFSKDPSDQIPHHILIPESILTKHLIAEEMKRSYKQSTCIIEALNTGSESNGCASPNCLSSVIIFGEGGWLCLDEIV